MPLKNNFDSNLIYWKITRENNPKRRVLNLNIIFKFKLFKKKIQHNLENMKINKKVIV